MTFTRNVPRRAALLQLVAVAVLAAILTACASNDPQAPSDDVAGGSAADGADSVEVESEGEGDNEPDVIVVDIPDSPLATTDASGVDGVDELTAAAAAAGVTLPVPDGTVVVETFATPGSEVATLLVPDADAEDVLHAIAAAYHAQGWPPTRERTESTNGDTTTYTWEFAAQPYGADQRAHLTVYQMDADTVVLLSLFVPDDALR